MANVQLKVNGNFFSGWTGATITRSMDAIADAFSVTGPRQYSAEFEAAFKPFKYQVVEVYVDSELILTGKIDKVSYSYGTQGATVNVQGRSKVGVLVDASLADVPYQWRDLDVMQVATLIGRKFGVEVEQSVGVMPKMANIVGEVGETCFDFLHRLATSNGYILKSLPNGRLSITLARNLIRHFGTLNESSSPVLSASADYDGSRRFSYTRVIAQQSGAPMIERVSRDGSITDYRPRIVVGSEGDAANMQAMADHERGMSISESINIQVVVSGWFSSGSILWAPEGTVEAILPSVFLKRPIRFLITDVQFTDDSGGQKATLKLSIPALYAQSLPTGGYPWE